MFTGLYPSQSKVITNKVDKLSNKTPVIAEILKDMGYFTMCFAESVFINKGYGMVRGFDKEFKVWEKSPWVGKKYKLLLFMTLLNKINSIIRKRIKFRLILNYWAHIRDRCERIIKWVTKKLFLKDILFKLKNDTFNDLDKLNVEINKNLNGNPLYLFINLLTPHDPYIPLKHIFKKFKITMKDFELIKDMLIDPLRYRLKVDIKSKRLSKTQVKIVKKLYNSCALTSDIMVNKIFSILKNLGLLENSYVIITSDHGEHLGDKLDHYLWEHSTYLSLYEGVIKVPLIIYNSKFKQKVIKNQVQLKDLFHTILHMSETPINENKYLEIKKSILYQVETNSMPKYIFGEFLKPKKALNRIINGHLRTLNRALIPKIKNEIYFLRSNDYKYIKYNKTGIEEFFDLSFDPHEQNNIAHEAYDIFLNMKNKMENLLNKIKDPEEIKEIITQREKDLIMKSINLSKIKSI